MHEIIQRSNRVLFFVVLVTVILYFGRTILIPIAFAALLAMLMAPLCSWLEHKGISRVVAVIACILILLLFILAMLGIVVIQVSNFSENLPELEQKVASVLSGIQNFIQAKFDIAPQKQVEILKNQIQGISKSATNFFTNILGGTIGVIGSLLLIMVYTFLLLYNHERYEVFFLKFTHHKSKDEAREMFRKIAHVSQRYLQGRVLSILILTVLYAIGLLIIGIKNAVLLSAVAALFTIIPYVGPFIGGLFPTVMALVTEDSFYPALWVIAVLFLIQTIDNYFIEPYVVGGEVNLSAMATIFILIAGGLLWGISGTILFLPLLGIFKIIFDHVPSLKPYGYLIGDPDHSKGSIFKKWIEKIKGFNSQ